MSDLFTRLAERSMRETEAPPTRGIVALDRPIADASPADVLPGAERAPARERIGLMSGDEGVTVDDRARSSVPTSSELEAARDPQEPSDRLPGPTVPAPEPDPLEPVAAAGPSDALDSVAATVGSVAPDSVAFGPAVTRLDPAEPDAARSGSPRPVPSQADPVPAISIVMAQPIPAEPAWPATARSSVAGGGASEPAVEVHIGRLDVRANLDRPAVPVRPQPTAEAEPELTLGAYLRGERTGP